MSYYIYQTEGIILGKTGTGEADVVLDVLTKDFGRVNILAQGTRHLKSKLRYNLKTFSHSRLGLVCGAKNSDFWRLVDAEETADFSCIWPDPYKSAVIFRVSELLRRMIAGSLPDPVLWKEIKNIFYFLAKTGELKKERLETFELLAKLRVLSCLGYIEDSGKWLSLNIGRARGMENAMSSVIEKSLEASHL